MPDEPIDLSVQDVSALGDSGPEPDVIEFGATPRANGLLVLGVAGIATVAAIVLISNHDDGQPTAAPTSLPTVSTLASSRAPVVVVEAPTRPAAALVEGDTTCFDAEPGRGGTVAFGIRNRMSHPIVVHSVSFAPQPGVGVAATSIGINRDSPTICPAARDLHPAANYRVAPGPVWISVRLARTPACGTELQSRWLITFTDRGQVHQVSFVGAGLTPNCPPRSHLSHGRWG